MTLAADLGGYARRGVMHQTSQYALYLRVKQSWFGLGSLSYVLTILLVLSVFKMFQR